MTHDELLAKISKEIDQAAYVGTDYPFKMLFALRAVVERHYAEEVHFGDVISQIECVECRVKYPCKTIDDIDKELK